MKPKYTPDTIKAMIKNPNHGTPEAAEYSEGFSLREYGRPRSFDYVNQVQLYSNEFPEIQKDPDVLKIPMYAHTVKYNVAYNYLKEDGWDVCWLRSTYTVREMEKPNMVYMTNPKYRGYLLEFDLSGYSIGAVKRKKFQQREENAIAPNMLKPDSRYNVIVTDITAIDEMTLYTPGRNTEYWNGEMVQGLMDFLNANCEKNVDYEESSVNIIVATREGYNVKNFSLEAAAREFNFPDLHYGEGFQSFHENLLTRINDETKGLVLFHGDPGTGKTQYIRHLLQKMSSLNKAVLYSPPAVTASLAEPQMINFISDWIMEENRDCILLIEDAEPLLESRSGGADGRSSGISNLLNITDGILNDILGLMVIATFNTSIDNIDSALLRPGRLIARKEFKKMPRERAYELAKELGLEFSTDKPEVSIAEFYNGSNDSRVLTHEHKETKKKMGF
jgi:hypothetical protein